MLICRPSQEWSDATVDGVLIHRRPTVHLRGLGRVVRDIELQAHIIGALSSFVRLAQARIVVDVIESPEWLAEGLLLGGLRNVALVMHLHTPVCLLHEQSGDAQRLSYRLSNHLERWSTHRSDAIMAASHMLAKRLVGAGWLPPQRMVDIIPLPVDMERVACVSGPQETLPIALAVGRVEARKAPELLASAVAMVAEEVPDAKAVFVGRSSGDVAGEPYVSWVSQRLSSAGRCTFVGEVSPGAVVAWYGRSRVVVVASRFESFSIAAVEGMAAGRPVVVSDSVGAEELVRDTGAGVVVPVGDVEVLAAAILPYLLDPVLAEKAGAEGRRIVAERCDPDTVAETRERVYKRAIASRRGGPGSAFRPSGAMTVMTSLIVRCIEREFLSRQPRSPWRRGGFRRRSARG